jgi:hypothetical protein
VGFGLLDKFILLISGLVDSISAPGMVVDDSTAGIYTLDGTLVFTINGLYQFINNDSNVAYQNFRAELYNNNLNEELAKLGYEVVSYDSTGKIDTSWYQLRPITV